MRGASRAIVGADDINVRQTVKRLLVILVALGLSGCANMRDSVMGNIRARSEIVAGIAPSYAEITMTWPADPSARRFFIRLPDGTFLMQEDFTYNRLRNAGFQDLPFWTKDFQETYHDLEHDKTYDVSHHLEGFGVHFIFVGEKLTEIHAYELPLERRKEGAAFGRDSNHGVLAGSVPFFSLPMTQGELSLVFGVPDKIEKDTFL